MESCHFLWSTLIRLWVLGYCRCKFIYSPLMILPFFAQANFLIIELLVPRYSSQANSSPNSFSLYSARAPRRCLHPSHVSRWHHVQLRPTHEPCLKTHVSFHSVRPQARIHQIPSHHWSLPSQGSGMGH